MNTSPLDDVAFKHLFSGDIDKAEEIWRKKEEASSLQNLIVCSLMRDDYTNAIANAEVLYGNVQYIKQFVQVVLGNESSLETTDLAYSFFDILCGEFSASKILPLVTESLWQKHIEEHAVKPLIDSIEGAIVIAKNTKGQGPNARLKAGEKLKKETRTILLQLKKFLTTKDLQYQVIADKLGLEILQCGIDYYNDSDDSDAAIKAMKLQKYALKIVIGQMAKDRCKENVDILQKTIDSLPPTEVLVEDKAIHEELRRYCLLPDKICHAVTLLNNAKPHLQAIKRKLGSTNDYYLKLSTLVINNALSNVIAEVNEAQSIFSADKYDHLALLSGISHVKSVLKEAWNATIIMDYFDMEEGFKRDRYNENRSTLKSNCEQLGVFPIPPGPGPSSSGCAITLLVWLLLGGVVGIFCVAAGGDFAAGFCISDLPCIVLYQILSD